MKLKECKLAPLPWWCCKGKDFSFLLAILWHVCVFNTAVLECDWLVSHPPQPHFDTGTAEGQESGC